MNKTNIGIGVLLCVILLATFTLDSPCKDVFSTADFARQTLNEYGFNHPLPSEWDGYMVQVKRNNAASRNHDFFRALDSDYLHMIIRHPDWDTNVQDISFVLFNPEEWNANADEVTGGDMSKLPPIVYFNEKYVYSVDPYDYKASKEKYDEIIEILFKFSYDTKQLDYKESFLVTIESDYIIYNEQSDQLSFTWRNILRDDVNAIGSYTIEKEVNSEWQVY